MLVGTACMGSGGVTFEFSTGGIVCPNYPLFSMGLKIFVENPFVHFTSVMWHLDFFTMETREKAVVMQPLCFLPCHL